MKFLIAFALLIVTVSCATPYLPSARSGTWLVKHERLVAQTKAHAAEVKAVFLGASGVEFFMTTGRQVWDEHYAPRGVYNYGIGGDMTQHVLWRIAHGEFDGLTPKLVVLHIGSNNIGSSTVADIAKGIKAVLEALHAKMPNTKILLMSILPRMPLAVDEQVQEINKLIVHYADNKHFYYFDANSHFETSVGHPIPELYTHDHVHVTAKGYEVLYEALEPTFKTLMA